MARTTAIVLAAGKGTRMKSNLPKVMHTLCGRPMIDYVLDAALAGGADDAVVVLGYGRKLVAEHLHERYADRVKIAVQSEQRGTGHAVLCALDALGDAKTVLVVNGDGPLLWAADLARLLTELSASEAALAMLTCRVADPHGYGRIVRQGGKITRVVEHRDCDPEQRGIDEINTGIYVVNGAFLRLALPQLKPNNDQGELYLTDIVATAAAEGVVGHVDGEAVSLGGINDRCQLADAERVLFERIADGHRRAGVTVRTGVKIDAAAAIEPDAIIEHNVVLRGHTQVATGARIDVGCVLEDVQVERDAYVKPYSVCAHSHIGPGAQVGPFTHLRPESRIDEGAKVGNFVEMKKVHLHKGAKANHLAYLGDGEVHEGANVGAGTIFCNYDGFQKHRTVIGKGAFIGSDSQLVAPVTIGDGAYVATGTTVTHDVPANGLAISRPRQETKEGYAPRLRARLKAAAKRAKE